MKSSSLKSALVLGILSMQFGVFAQDAVKHEKHVHQNNIIHKSSVGPNGQVRCYTMEADSMRRAADPSLPTLAQEEAWLQQKIEEYQQMQAAGAKKTQYTIPIIFHIFTDGSGSENVSATQIQAQVDQLNLDYSDQAGSPYGQSADCQIQFCLALVDENGTPLAEPGIERITSYGQGSFSQSDFENGMKAATIWDPTEYFNVWVANLSGGLLGYAQFPSNSGLSGLSTNGGSANTDGVVILYSSVGSVASPFNAGSYAMGRTLTHEAGHWLGLRHIWGDSNCGDDFCSDTPESQTSNFGCPSNQTTCDGNQDMVENYMDYTDDDCMNTFTANQATRMQTVMGVSPRRSTLGQNGSCNLATDPDNIGVSTITSPTGTICASNFTPQVTITNYGTNSVSSFTLTYNIDGSGSQTYNWTGTLAVGQSVTITLTALTTTNGSHTFNATTSLPNGVTDTNTSNDASSSSFSITATGQEIHLLIDTDCWGEEVAWELFDDQGSLLLTGGNQNITTPVTTTQTTTTADPGAYGSEVHIDEELCLASGCYDLIMWDAYGDGMNGSASQGCTTDGDFSVEDAVGTVLASMQAANADYGHSETVSFCIGSTESIDELVNGGVVIYPNPSEGIFNVVLSGEASGVNVTVLDISGRVVMEQSKDENMFAIDLSGAAAGTYTVVISGNKTMMKRVVVK